MSFQKFHVGRLYGKESHAIVGTGTSLSMRYGTMGIYVRGSNLRDLAAVRYSTSKKVTSTAAFFLYDSEQLHILISIITVFMLPFMSILYCSVHFTDQCIPDDQ
jgi:hypothetical protein